MGKCLQIIFVALNLLIGIGGLGLLGLSLWLLLDSESFYKVRLFRKMQGLTRYFSARLCCPGDF